MASNCPSCGKKVDTQANFDCPECGERFWQNKELYSKREIKKSTNADISKPAQELPISFWWRIIISPRFSEYFLKGFLSGFIVLVLAFFFSDVKIGEAVIWKFLLVEMLSYWLAITVGYIYGYSKLKSLSNKTNQETESYQTGKVFCHECGKKIDDDSIFCIFCGSKIIVDHHEDKN